MDQNKDLSNEAQLSMKIGNNSVAELPPQLKRGGDFDA